MAGLNCLIRNTQLKEYIMGLIADISATRLENNQSIKIQDIYKEILGLGIEVDSESIGAMYNEVFASENSDEFSSAKEVEEYVMKDFENAQKELVNAILGTTPDTTQTLGKNSIERSTVMAISKLFQMAQYPTLSTRAKSMLVKMQEIVKKAVVNSTPRATPQTNTKSINEILQNFFDVEATEMTQLDGTINNMETVINEVKRGVKSYLDEVTSGMSDTEANIVKNQWETFTNSFVNSMYDIILSRGEQKLMLDEVMKQVELNGEKVVDAKGNIMWSKLSKNGNSNEVAQKAKELLENGFTDSSGKRIKYTSVQAQRLADYLKNLYEQKIISVIQKDLANQASRGGKNKSKVNPKQLVSDFLKSLGYFKMIKDGDGKLSKTQIRWDNLIKDIEKGIASGNKNVIDEISEQLERYLTQKDSAGNPIFDLSNEQIADLVKGLKDDITDKLLPATANATTIEKFAALSRLEGGRAFNETTQQALHSVIGIPINSQQVLTQLHELSKLAQQISDNPSIEHAQQYFSQIQRRIEELIMDYKNQAGGLPVHIQQLLEDIMSASKGSLLLNPNNMIENVTTTIATTVTQTLRAMLANPKIAKTVVKNIAKGMINGLLSHTFGGSHESVVNEYDKLPQISAGERYRFKGRDIRNFRQLMKDEFKAKGLIGMTRDQATKLGLKLYHTFIRVAMNSFDVAGAEAMTQASFIDAVGSRLKDSVGEKKANAIMEKVFKVTETQKAQMNFELEELEKQMNSLGIYPTAFDRNLARHQALKGLYFQNLYGIEKSFQKEEVKRNIKAVANSAMEVAKALGGKKRIKSKAWDIASLTYFLGSGILGVQSYFMDSAEKSRAKGDLGIAQTKQFLTTVLLKNGVASFLGGRLNFLYLGLTATPLGIISSLAQRSLAKDYIEEHPTSKYIDKASPEELAKYTEFMQLSKEFMARSLVGTIALTAYILANAFDDDDKDGWFDEIIDNLSSTKSGQNFIAKHFPMVLSTVALINAETKNKRLQTRGQKIIDVIQRYMQTNPGMERLVEQLERDKNDENLPKHLLSYIGSLYSGNINQAEQFTRFNHVIKSAFNKDGAIEVLRDEQTASQTYKDMETLTDYYMGTGIYSTLKRQIETGEVNRMKRD